ncbi:MAG: hypothetical protein ACK5KT_14875 [Dysgonomonas sp.]
MKKFAKIFMLFFVSATVFLTGAGVTIINYCCTSCSGQTLFMTEKHVCCADSEHSHEAKSCCSHAKEMSNDTCEGLAYKDLSHCTASRVSIDIDASSYRPQISIPFVWISDVMIFSTERLTADNEIIADTFTHLKAPPEIPPREYLSLIQVLII